MSLPCGLAIEATDQMRVGPYFGASMTLVTGSGEGPTRSASIYDALFDALHQMGVRGAMWECVGVWVNCGNAIKQCPLGTC